MKRNFLLIGVVFLVLMIIVNSTKRISSLRNTSQKVGEVEQQLEVLRRDNENLKAELEYKRGEEFKEAEIRNKLGMVKPGEAVVVLPNDNSEQQPQTRAESIPNYIKWWNLFFQT